MAGFYASGVPFVGFGFVFFKIQRTLINSIRINY
jgi:hypothetical protein